MSRIPVVLALSLVSRLLVCHTAIAPLQGRYLGDQEAIRAKILGVANQTGQSSVVSRQSSVAASRDERV
jgi:hypothetical protein